MLDNLLKYWQLVTIIVAIIAGSVSGYVWLDDRFDVIEIDLREMDDKFVPASTAGDLARSDAMNFGFEKIADRIEEESVAIRDALDVVRCELDALIRAGDQASAAEAIDGMKKVLELEKHGIIRSLGDEPSLEDSDRLEQIRDNLRALTTERDRAVAEAEKYRRIVETRGCEE